MSDQRWVVIARGFIDDEDKSSIVNRPKYKVSRQSSVIYRYLQFGGGAQVGRRGSQKRSI